MGQEDGGRDEVSGGGAVDRWLVRALILTLVALLGFSSYLLWRISMVAYRAEALLMGVSGEIEQVVRTSARVAERIDELDQAVGDLREKSRNMIKPDEVTALIDTLEQAAADAHAGGKTAPDVEEEISALLDAVRTSNLSFVRRGDPHSGAAFSLWLQSKMLRYPGQFASAEEFIDKIATQSVLGTRYNVILQSGEKQDLANWLKEKLARLRAAKTAPEPSAEPARP
jgi:hypothetical protein